jgi:hypothetical protein
MEVVLRRELAASSYLLAEERPPAVAASSAYRATAFFLPTGVTCASSASHACCKFETVTGKGFLSA